MAAEKGSASGDALDQTIHRSAAETLPLEFIFHSVTVFGDQEHDLLEEMLMAWFLYGVVVDSAKITAKPTLHGTRILYTDLYGNEQNLVESSEPVDTIFTDGFRYVAPDDFEPYYGRQHACNATSATDRFTVETVSRNRPIRKVAFVVNVCLASSDKPPSATPKSVMVSHGKPTEFDLTATDPENFRRGTAVVTIDPAGLVGQLFPGTCPTNGIGGDDARITNRTSFPAALGKFKVCYYLPMEEHLSSQDTFHFRFDEFHGGRPIISLYKDVPLTLIPVNRVRVKSLSTAVHANQDVPVQLERLDGPQSGEGPFTTFVIDSLPMSGSMWGADGEEFQHAPVYIDAGLNRSVTITFRADAPNTFPDEELTLLHGQHRLLFEYHAFVGPADDSFELGNLTTMPEYYEQVPEGQQVEIHALMFPHEQIAVSWARASDKRPRLMYPGVFTPVDGVALANHPDGDTFFREVLIEPPTHSVLRMNLYQNISFGWNTFRVTPVLSTTLLNVIEVQTAPGEPLTCTEVGCQGAFLLRGPQSAINLALASLEIAGMSGLPAGQSVALSLSAGRVADNVREGLQIQVQVGTGFDRGSGNSGSTGSDLADEISPDSSLSLPWFTWAALGLLLLAIAIRVSAGLRRRGRGKESSNNTVPAQAPSRLRRRNAESENEHRVCMSASV